jgi:predicted nucleic acid-binding protein
VKLAADASALIEESLRRRGRRLIVHDDLDLYFASPMWSEVLHEIGPRVDSMIRHGHLEESERAETIDETETLLRRALTVVTEAKYGQYETEARDRIPRDPNDWPTVALALTLNVGIWTSDRDFFGCGVPVWTTEILLTHLASGRARVDT